MLTIYTDDFTLDAARLRFLFFVRFVIYVRWRGKRWGKVGGGCCVVVCVEFSRLASDIRDCISRLIAHAAFCRYYLLLQENTTEK